MRRRSVQKQAIGVSLFPFLAVLICTMGALIVLLVMVVQQARVSASAEVAQRAQPSAAQLQRQQERDEYLWRWDTIARQRALSTEELADKRLELSHLEDHIREIEQRWNEMVAAQKELDRLAKPRDEDRQAAERRLAELQGQIASTAAELDEARQRKAKEPSSFALIPYDGPQGTHRYPMYVECRSDGVFIQPEGIALQPDDFLGPLGPGNPLDAALRAKREHLIRVGVVTPQQEPYPLLVVRPDGIEAYAMARAAMRAWDDEFGYELIESETRLSYSAPDPSLATQLTQVVEVARKRQSALAAAMPSRFDSNEPISFVASSEGGFVPARPLDRQSGGRRSRRGSRGAEGSEVGGGSGGPGSGDDSDRDAIASRTSGRPAAGQFTAGRSGQNAGANAVQKPGSEGAEASPPGDAGSQDNSATRAAATGAPGGRRTRAGRPGGSDGNNSPLGSSFGGSSGGKRAGRNFGLPDYDEAKTEITRPIRVVCSPDRLVIMPERGVEPFPRTILITDDTQQNLDQLISNVWSRMDRWGIAVPGGYWKPVLEVQVAAGAETQFAQLETLLRDSGIVVERKTR